MAFAVVVLVVVLVANVGISLHIGWVGNSFGSLQFCVGYFSGVARI